MSRFLLPQLWGPSSKFRSWGQQLGLYNLILTPTLSSERARRRLLLRQGLPSSGWNEFGVSILTARSRGHCPLTCHLFPSQQREAFKKRWFTLDHRRLMYFKDPLVRGRCDRRAAAGSSAEGRVEVHTESVLCTRSGLQVSQLLSMDSRSSYFHPI